jgi:hypothetical protein
MTFTYLSVEDVEAIVPPTCKTLCLFASYQPRDQSHIHEENVKYVSSLANCFDTVVLLTNIRDRSIHHTLPHNVVVVTLENMCYDFGMWFRFLYNYNTTKLSRLGLVNDSCTLLRSQDLESILEQTQASFWGMTDSHECGVHHIQSYFMMFEGMAIQRLKDFVKESNISSYVGKPKSDIVKGFELGLSQYMSKCVPIQVVYPYSSLFHIPSKWGTFANNPSYSMWDRLLIGGMPILKKGRVHYEDEDAFIATFSESI